MSSDFYSTLEGLREGPLHLHIACVLTKYFLILPSNADSYQDVADAHVFLYILLSYILSYHVGPSGMLAVHRATYFPKNL